MSAGRPGRADVTAAADRIGPYIHRTAVLHSRSIDALAGCRVVFKCENFQRSGSFKMRGALAVLSADLTRAQECGAVTHSSGNHGAALALAGRLLGVTVTVVMPATASAFKRRAVERYGARIVDCGPTLEERETALAAVQAGAEMLFVPPYDHPHIVAGQGTATQELLEQAPDIDTVWVPVGGGGLASGAVLAAGGSGVRVRAGEPELADDAWRGLACGVRQPAPPPRTAADGLRTALGELNFEILHDYALAVTRVSEQAILDAQRLMWNCLKIVAEPSSAVALAALLEAGGDGCAGVIVSGGNVDLPTL
ncbi:MAG: pyridoxal-phosphate dependent enzyme [Gammaproteobacteria bacterium]|nr:pyridoxal-phosphate dependent enzyme [Gammaproteobacteria bacterium]